MHTVAPSEKQPRNLRKAGFRALIVWTAVGVIAALLSASGTYTRYKASFGPDFTVSIYSPNAHPENANFWGSTKREDMPISLTNVRYLHCYRSLIGRNSIQHFRGQSANVPGGYVLSEYVDREWTFYSEHPSPERIARKQCIDQAASEHKLSWLRLGWDKYVKQFLQPYVIGTLVVVAAFLAGRWILTGAKETP